jgi:hypothetical protein
MNHSSHPRTAALLIMLALVFSSSGVRRCAADESMSNQDASAIGPDKVESLLDDILHSSGEKRTRALSSLKRAGQTDVPSRVVARLKVEADPNKRGSLVFVLAGCSSTGAVHALVEQLDDRRDAQTKCPECIGRPLRVSDLAFNVLIEKLAKRRFLHESKVIQSSKLRSAERAPVDYSLDDFCEGGLCGISMRDPLPARDQAITILRQYLEGHWEQMLQTLAGTAPDS